VLGRIVNRPGVNIISSSLEVAPFNEFLAETENPQEVGPAFSACAYAGIACSEFILLTDGRQSLKVKYVFEKGDREHEIANAFADLEKNDSNFFGLRAHGFQPKQTTTLLQPADLIAGMIQRCLITAHRSFRSLDNGLGFVRLNTFERYYSSDGVTAALVAGHDTKTCYIHNARAFMYMNEMSTEFFKQNPGQLEKRKKRLTFKPKKRK
ncbi:MAG: hypothetical protein WCF22_13400, partial [Candidatus Sulfotelmatobacter sp.]